MSIASKIKLVSFPKHLPKPVPNCKIPPPFSLQFSNNNSAGFFCSGNNDPLNSIFSEKNSPK